MPDFQRPWKWDDDRIASLLATVTMGYPVGVMMALQTGGENVRFKPRLLEGAESPAAHAPEMLLLDGQQRMTSLLQSLGSDGPVKTMDARKKKLLRWYYIDIAEAIRDEVDREEAIVSVPAGRILYRNGRSVDLTTTEREAEEGLFPLRLVFDTPATQRWMRRYARDDNARWTAWEHFTTKVLNNVVQFQVPVIMLTRDTPKEAVCTVFEKVNTGGVALNVFELVTASYAADRAYFDKHGEDFRLHEDWDRIWADLSANTMLTSQTTGLGNTDLLQAVTLVSTYYRRRGRTDIDPYSQPAASCKRKDILDLPLEEYLRWSPQVVDALHWTAQFLRRQCVFKVSDIPYNPQLIALAAIRTVLGAETDERDAEAKISRWYWCGVFGEQYGGATEARLPRDLEQVVAWVRGGREPASVGEALFQESRLGTLRTRGSAAYKGTYALLMKQECKDWAHDCPLIDEKLYLDQSVDLVRIFPKKWCEQNGIGYEQYDSIVNKTLLTHRAGQLVGTRPPQDYLRVLESDTSLPGNWLDDVVATHLVEPTYLRTEDFAKFYQERAARLLALIESAMEKRAVPAAEAPESSADYEQENA